MSDIRRLYVRKKEGFRQGEESLTRQLREVLGDRISDSAIYHRYDVDGLTDEDYEKAVATVFSEPPVDDTETALPKGDLVLGVEFLPGQYDQRADSAEQCLAIVTGKDGARVRCALVYAFHGHFEKGDREKIVKFLVNPVESREASLAPAETLDLPIEDPKPVPVVKGLRNLDDKGMDDLISSMGLAMSHEDLAMIRDYHCDVMVTKNSGLIGGSDTKLKAAMDSGISVIVIDKPKADLKGVPVFDTTEGVLKYMEEHYGFHQKPESH